MSPKMLIVTAVDCGTLRGLTATPLKKNEDIVETLVERIVGRTSVYDVLHPDTDELIVATGEEITEEVASAIEDGWN